VAISDYVNGSTRYKRKAKWLSFYHAVTPQAGVNLQLVVLITAYAAVEGSPEEYGPQLIGPQFRAYESTLQADESTLVDATSGEVLAVRGALMPEAWQALTDSFEQDIMLQTEYFARARDLGAVAIAPMVLHHIAQADALGRFS
jgi:hypothetical protein